MPMNELQLYRKLQEVVGQLNIQVVNLYQGTTTTAEALAVVKPLVDSLAADLAAEV